MDAATDSTVPVLDSSQTAVLALDDGVSATVLGAPGTGKTTTLVELLAHRVRDAGYLPSEVLALAPSRGAATRLRDRLALRLAVPTNGPLARTANSVAFQLVRAAVAAEGGSAAAEGVTLLTGNEQDAIVAELLAGHVLDARGPSWPENLAPELRGLQLFRTELREFMMRCVEHGIDPAALRQLSVTAGEPAWAAAADFIAEYAEVVEQSHGQQFDAAELAAYGARIVSEAPAGEAASATLGTLAKLRLIVIDDVQDASAGTISLLRAFAARGCAIVAFGDPDVATGAFRGARADVLGELGELLGERMGPGGTQRALRLDTVHRGGTALRMLVQTITGHIGTARAGTQRTATVAADARDDETPVLRIEADSPAAEYEQLARVLRERHLRDEIPWSRMAVVVRSGALIPALKRALAISEVPTQASSARLTLRDDPAAGRLLAAANVVTGRLALDPELAVELLTGPLGGIDGVQLRRLRLSMRHEELAGGGARSSDELLVEALAAPSRFASIDSAPARRAGALSQLLAEARTVADGGGSIEEVLWQLWNPSKLAESWGKQARGGGVLADEANRALDGVVALFAAAQRFAERKPGLPARPFLDELFGSEVPEDTLAPRAEAEAVFVGSPASVVGMEVDVLAIAGLHEGVWPNMRPRGSLLNGEKLLAVLSGEAIADVDARAEVRSGELRMLALAASRAHRQLVLSTTSSEDIQPSRFLAVAAEAPLAPPPGPDRRPLHMRGLIGALRRELSRTGRAEAASGLAILAANGLPGADPAEWYGLGTPSTTAPLIDLEQPDAVVRVSPSAIEKAEESSLMWFIDAMASPASGLAASLGTLVHAVMETVSERSDRDTSLDTVWAEVEARWGQLHFEGPWHADSEKAKARVMAEGVAGYLSDFVDDGKTLVSAEGSFTTTVGQIAISAKIDRVERNAEGAIVIVDLKTGKYPPTIKSMPEHAQLAAYQLVFEAVHVERGIEGQLAGAKLVFAGKADKGAPYTLRQQPALDEKAAAAFRERLTQVGELMADAVFYGPAETAANDRFNDWNYRIHLVPGVSA